MIPDTPSTPEEEFDKLGNSAGMWMFYGLSLHRSAFTIKESLVTPAKFRQGVYGMLLGYAVEAYLKALWLTKGNVIAESGQLAPVPGGRSHRLVPLADKVGIALSEPERDVLERLPAFIRFAGRYPIAPDATEMDIREHRNGGLIRPGTFRPDDWKIAEDLALRIHDIVTARVQEPGQP